MLRQLLTITTALAMSAHASIIRVPADQPTIQAGIDAAAEGDTVLVAPGTYSGPGDERITFHGIDRVLASETGAERTVIRGTGEYPGLYFNGGESRDSTVRGFTITHCGPYFIWRGAITCEGASPQIIDCIVTDNTDARGLACMDSAPLVSNCIISDNRGGGVYCLRSPALLVSCRISDNRGATLGGGIYCYRSSPTLTNCIISGNSVWDVAGGLLCDTYSSPNLTNCVISGNEARVGGGLGIYEGSAPTLMNCSVTINLASQVGGGLRIQSSSPNLTNCILWANVPDEINNDPQFPGNPTIRYCDVEGGYEGEGNIDTPPLFRSVRGFKYVLGPNSPCIDAGDPSIKDGISDWYPRWPEWYPNRRRSDMGAYGGPGNWRWLVNGPPRRTAHWD